MLNIKLVRLAILLVIGFYTGTAISASNTILSNQNFSYIGKDGRLVVEFFSPMGYISHFPAKKANTLKLQLKELFPRTQNTTDTLRETLAITSKQKSPVLEIRYEQKTGQAGTLTIQFSRTLDFEIKMSRDRKSLTIKLKNVRADTTGSIKPEGLGTGLPIYTLNLKTSSSPIDIENQPPLTKFSKYDRYITESAITRKTIYALHVGYFYSPSAAKANLRLLKPFYPQAWIGKVQPERRKTAETWFLDLKIAQVKKRKKKAKPEKADLLMDRARQAMLDNNYKQAIRLLTRIQQLGSSNYIKESKELLGLARERNGQIAHAKAEYQEYLKLYPDGEDAERVKQRLLGLLTALSKPRAKLGKRGPKAAEPEWELFGSFFQFYRNQTTSTDATSNQTTDSSLLTDMLYTGRKRGTEYNQRFDIAGSHRYDFLDKTDKSDARIQTFYYELSKRDNDHAVKFGRQTHSTDGVFGRFDGIRLNKHISVDQNINFLAGFPVDLGTSDGLNTGRQFYALSYDIDSFFIDADFKFYIIDQTNHDLTDRRAIGTQLKYFDDTISYFASIDYDIFYSELNQLTFTGSWRNKQNSTLNIVADYRKSPLLTTNNALIGQLNVSNLSDLRLTYTDDQIYQLAQDRTTTYSALTVAASTYLTERYQLNGDITLSKLDGTIASGGVDAIAGTGIETFYNANLVVSNFFTRNDITIFGARYSDASTSDTIQLNFSANFNLNRKWRVNPRFIFDTRDNSSGSSRTSFKPRVIVNYRPSRALKYELDMGYEDAKTESTITTTETNFYIFLGYLYDF